jgi:hypothetical protein
MTETQTHICYFIFQLISTFKPSVLQIFSSRDTDGEYYITVQQFVIMTLKT